MEPLTHREITEIFTSFKNYFSEISRWYNSAIERRKGLILLGHKAGLSVSEISAMLGCPNSIIVGLYKKLGFTFNKEKNEWSGEILDNDTEIWARKWLDGEDYKESQAETTGEDDL